MTLQQLKYVTAIADCGSMNEAAKTLFVSQPSLSGAVKELEEEAGIEIFKRTNKGVLPTPEGGRVSWLREAAAQSVRTVGGSLYPENAGKEKI